MKTTVAALTATVLVIALNPTMNAAGEEAKKPLVLKDQGSFFVGGETKSIPAAAGRGAFGSGDMTVNQMYVQFMLPVKEAKKAHIPIAIVHGCCLSTKSWQTTPDGRMGFDEYFVRQKFDTYMIDQVGRARSVDGEGCGLVGLRRQQAAAGSRFRVCDDVHAALYAPDRCGSTGRAGSAGSDQ